MPDWSLVILDAAILLPVLMGLVRLAGLRTFAKMSAHDFAVTVATGSVLAATVLDPDVPWWMGALALAALFAVQAIISWARRRWHGVQRALDNEPLVLVRGGVPDEGALAAARLSRDDLRQKLRLAGVSRMDDAALVVLETTGDVSVLQRVPEPELTREVRGSPPHGRPRA
jgi:uncharacterized membrane protein YcaP (DUF421 family)